ncbi:MAG TPA: hypothetical protein VMH27_17065 [Puia sp.]|nr:hypothetical protein [Puia sp.]
MLQNRVDPKGDLIRTPARGSWTGNRGVIHDGHRNIVRPFKRKAWLICLLEFKGRQRQVMTPNRWTELFFLDEATAFSAGHRPCAECRRQAFNRFKHCWISGNPEFGFTDKTPIWKIDDVLHKERINRSAKKVTYTGSVDHLPAGVFVLYRGEPYLFAGGLFLRWTPEGYDDGVAVSGVNGVEILTPRSVVKAFRAGYKPQMAVTSQSVPR